MKCRQYSSSSDIQLQKIKNTFNGLFCVFAFLFCLNYLRSLIIRKKQIQPFFVYFKVEKSRISTLKQKKQKKQTLRPLSQHHHCSIRFEIAYIQEEQEEVTSGKVLDFNLLIHRTAGNKGKPGLFVLLTPPPRCIPV